MYCAVVGYLLSPVVENSDDQIFVCADMLPPRLELTVEWFPEHLVVGQDFRPASGRLANIARDHGAFQLFPKSPVSFLRLFGCRL